jgi:uncharacterized protein with HEPN domain
MLDYAREAAEFVESRTLDELQSDRVGSLASIRMIEIVGEAARRVSSGTRALNPDIPWGMIVAMRNRLIHAYTGVDIEIVYVVGRDDLPHLVGWLARALDEGLFDPPAG